MLKKKLNVWYVSQQVSECWAKTCQKNLGVLHNHLRYKRRIFYFVCTLSFNLFLIKKWLSLKNGSCNLDKHLKKLFKYIWHDQSVFHLARGLARKCKELWITMLSKAELQSIRWFNSTAWEQKMGKKRPLNQINYNPTLIILVTKFHAYILILRIQYKESNKMEQSFRQINFTSYKTNQSLRQS